MDADQLKQLLAQEFAKYAGSASTSGLGKKARKALKKDGNEEQFAHQEELLSIFTSVKGAIEREQYEVALAEVEKGIKKTNKRMKVIKVADRSKYGWETAMAYMSDDLASDSEDEKKLKRAENEAAKKRKERDEEYAKKSKFPRNYIYPKTAAAQGASETPQQFFRASQNYRAPKYASRCYGCGKIGHWRQSCPSLNPAPRPEYPAVLDKPSTSTQ